MKTFFKTGGVASIAMGWPLDAPLHLYDYDYDDDDDDDGDGDDDDDVG